MKLKSLTLYYLQGLLPLMLLLISFYQLPVSVYDILLFSIGFVCPYAIMTPGMSDRVRSKKYKFSLMAMFFHLNQLCIERLPDAKRNLTEPLARTIVPGCLALSMILLSGYGSLLFTLMGNLVFEVIYFFLLKEKCNT